MSEGSCQKQGSWSTSCRFPNNRHAFTKPTLRFSTPMRSSDSGLLPLAGKRMSDNSAQQDWFGTYKFRRGLDWGGQIVLERDAWHIRQQTVAVALRRTEIVPRKGTCHGKLCG